MGQKDVEEKGLPPKGVGDHRQRSDIGREEEEADEDGLHLGSPSSPPGGLAVVHETHLRREDRVRGDSLMTSGR